METFFLVLGIALCVALLALAYLYFKEGKQKQIDALAETARWREERRAAGFWNGVERRAPERDIAFSTDERAAAALRVPVESVNEPHLTYAEEMAARQAVADTLAPVVAVEPPPKYDYPNVDGFPFSGTVYQQFKDEMTKHGFVMRFVMATKEVQVIYEKPGDATAPVLRKLYVAPSAIFPLNLLHDNGCIQTALWAMRKFKSEEHPPELDAFIYL